MYPILQRPQQPNDGKLLVAILIIIIALAVYGLGVGLGQIEP